MSRRVGAHAPRLRWMMSCDTPHSIPTTATTEAARQGPLTTMPAHLAMAHSWLPSPPVRRRVCIAAHVHPTWRMRIRATRAEEPSSGFGLRHLAAPPWRRVPTTSTHSPHGSGSRLPPLRLPTHTRGNARRMRRRGGCGEPLGRRQSAGRKDGGPDTTQYAGTRSAAPHSRGWALAV